MFGSEKYLDVIHITAVLRQEFVFSAYLQAGHELRTYLLNYVRYEIVSLDSAQSSNRSLQIGRFISCLTGNMDYMVTHEYMQI